MGVLQAKCVRAETALTAQREEHLAQLRMQQQWFDDTLKDAFRLHVINEHVLERAIKWIGQVQARGLDSVTGFKVAQTTYSGPFADFLRSHRQFKWCFQGRIDQDWTWRSPAPMHEASSSSTVSDSPTPPPLKNKKGPTFRKCRLSTGNEKRSPGGSVGLRKTLLSRTFLEVGAGKQVTSTTRSGSVAPSYLT